MNDTVTIVKTPVRKTRRKQVFPHLKLLDDGAYCQVYDLTMTMNNSKDSKNSKNSKNTKDTKEKKNEQEENQDNNNEEFVLKVLDSGEDEGICPAQLHECDFYARLEVDEESFPFLNGCRCIDFSVCVTEEKLLAASIALQMPKMYHNMHTACTSESPKKPPLLDMPKRILILPTLVENITMALSRLHQSDYLHRDVKPGNIMSNKDFSKFYLIDFGSMNMESVTTRNTEWCTYEYSSPEAAPPKKQKPYSFASDIYSLGATLISILFGVVPYVEKKRPANWIKILMYRVSISKFDVPQSWVKILCDCVSRVPEERPSLMDIRKVFQLTCSSSSSLMKPLRLKKIDAPLYDHFMKKLNSEWGNVEEKYPIIIHWVIETHERRRWDKRTYLLSIQLFEDFCMASRNLIIIDANVQYIMAACVSLAQKMLEDHYLDLFDMVETIERGSSPAVLFHRERQVWEAMQGFILRRPFDSELLQLSWQDLEQYTLRHTI